MRLGFVIPSVNVVIEEDLRRFLPEDVSAHITRVALTGTTAANLRDALEASVPAARLLAHAGVDAIALACTGASIMGGGSGGPANALEEASGVPALDTMQALTGAFAALGATRIMLFSPFDDAFNEIEAAALSKAGLDVVHTVGLGIRDPRLCPAVTADAIVERVAAVDDPSVEAIFLSCANLRGFEAIAAIEQRLGKPVVSTNQAILWALLRKAGSSAVIANGGRLFSH